MYADALQEANDPRGELIVLNQAVAKGMSTADRDAYVEKHRASLFGPAADLFGLFRVDWVGCVADKVAIRIPPSETPARVMSAFLDSPLASGVREIELVGQGSKHASVDLTAAVGLLIEKWPASATSLALVDERASQTTMLASRDYDPDENLVTFGSLAGLWKLPLETLRIEVADAHQLDLGTIDAPKLRSFTFRNLRWVSAFGDPPGLNETFATASWPELRSFELRLTEEFGANIIADEDAYVPRYHDHEDYQDRYDEADEGENYEGANWEQLRPVLDNLVKTPLERLALTSFDSASSLLATLAAAGLPPKLAELELSHSSVSDAAWFLENAARFHGIKRLVLEKVSMTDDEAKRLATLGPEIVHSHGSGATYRYVVGSE